MTPRYPEKTYFLGRVFEDTSNSYKLFWFLAILSVLNKCSEHYLRLTDIFTEMAVAAWHPVCLFRLSLGRQDKLQEVILKIQTISGLAPNASEQIIRNFVHGSSEVRKMLDYFRRYVPTRFLSPWFADELRSERDDNARTREIQRLAKESQTTTFACPYHFEAGSIRLNKRWRSFLTENMGVVQSFAEHHLASYLQRRNPNVPGILNKLHSPTLRQLTTAGRFWELVRDEFARTGRRVLRPTYLDPVLRRDLFIDIYSERQLIDIYSIDHFLPWTFVVHDLLWNLTPVEAMTNSRKGDVLPDIDIYLPRLAKLQFSAIEVAKNHPNFLEDYVDCFKQDVGRLLELGASGLTARYHEVMIPQAQIAINQGFQSGWKLLN